MGSSIVIGFELEVCFFFAHSLQPNPLASPLLPATAPQQTRPLIASVPAPIDRALHHSTHKIHVFDRRGDSSAFGTWAPWVENGVGKAGRPLVWFNQEVGKSLHAPSFVAVRCTPPRRAAEGATAAGPAGQLVLIFRIDFTPNLVRFGRDLASNENVPGLFCRTRWA